MAGPNQNSERERATGPDADPQEWVARYGDLLYRYALARTADPAEAEELVQETFLAGLQGLGRFRSGSALSTWLVGILKHKIIDYFRRRLRGTDLGFQDVVDEAWEEQQVRANQYRWDADPHQVLEQRQLRQALARCLAELSLPLRATFVLREMDGLSTEQICKELQLSPTNLWVRLYRARGVLRNCLEGSWFKQGRSSPLGKPRRGRKFRSSGRSSSTA